MSEKETTEIEVSRPKTLLGSILEHSQIQDDKFLAVHKENTALLRQILTELKELRECLNQKLK